jgi:hypothetical protein
VGVFAGSILIASSHFKTRSGHNPATGVACVRKPLAVSAFSVQAGASPWRLSRLSEQRSR